MLLTATVNKIRCDFVKKMYDYIICRKYSLDCCLDDPKEAFLNAKLATFTDCDLSHSIECTLNSLKLNDYYTDCTVPQTSIACEDQASLSVSIQALPVTPQYLYLRNRVTNSSNPYVTLLNDTIYQGAEITLISTDSPVAPTLSAGVFSVGAQYEIYDEVDITSGTQLVGLTPTELDGYNIHGYIQALLPGVQNLDGYLTSVRLHSTDTAGNYTGTYYDVDVNPFTTPYLTFGGSPYTVTDTDLYFTSPN